MVRQENKTGMLFIPVALYTILFILAVKIRPFVLHDRNASCILLVAAYCVLGCIGIYIFREYFRKGIAEWKEHGMKSMLWLIGGYITDILFTSLLYYPQYTLYPDYEGLNNNNIAAAAKMVSAPLFIAAAGIFGPVTEEIVFRFILVDKLKSRIPAFVCIILSSALFMIWHMHAFTLPELLVNLPKFVTGLVYGMIMLRSENPTISVLLHVFNNTSGLLIMLMNGAQ